MALSDRLVTTERKSPFQTWLESLSAKNAAVVNAWLKDPSISNQRVTEMIRDDDPDDEFKGYAVGKDTMAKYRRTLGVNR